VSALRVHVLYEHGVDLNPYCSGHIRLLRPLAHPTVRDRVCLTSSRRYEPGEHDLVIVERLWRPDISLEVARELIARVRTSGARLIYSQDDNTFDLRQGLSGQDWFTDEHVTVMELFAREADGVLVTTEPLRRRMAGYNARIRVLPNVLDERLICSRPEERSRRAHGPLVVGCMGTRNHDEDLEMIGSALRQVHRRWKDAVRFEVIGVARSATLRRFADLPLRVVQPDPIHGDYPLFFAWYTRTAQWDVAIAPLRDNVFNVCKSDIKFLDYSAIGAAGVFSRLQPYDSVIDGELGLLVDADPAAWSDALDRLLGDEPLRRHIADAASHELLAHRTLSRWAPRWVDALEELLA